jgi:hypothetical protein
VGNYSSIDFGPGTYIGLGSYSNPPSEGAKTLINIIDGFVNVSFSPSKPNFPAATGDPSDYEFIGKKQ